MSKSKKKIKVNFRCSSCGFTCETEDELLKHCEKEHPDDHYLTWSMLGRFTNLDQAQLAYRELNQEILDLNSKQSELLKELKSLSNLVTKQDNELKTLNTIAKLHAKTFTTIHGSLSLLSESITGINNIRKELEENQE